MLLKAELHALLPSRIFDTLAEQDQKCVISSKWQVKEACISIIPFPSLQLGLGMGLG